MQPNPLAADLDHVLAHTEGLWEPLRGQRVFITGGTGFFGCWLLESFAWANDRLGLGATAEVLTRDLEAFRKKCPHLASQPAIRFHVGDVKNFLFPSGRFAGVIHAATQSSVRVTPANLVENLDTVVGGTRRALDFAVASGAARFLLTSSGAVYGRLPETVTHVPEEYPGGPDVSNPFSVYAESKRLAELECAIYQECHGLEPKIARSFAFVGPYLPLDAHFAIGNFIRDALAGGPIRVQGDGTPRRSYLYGADLAVWLWTIFFRGKPGRAYNVGSGEAISVGELAEAVSRVSPGRPPVQIAERPTDDAAVEWYVPAVERARRELGLAPVIGLEESVRRTMQWHATRMKRGNGGE
ncbi:MAG TPA: NAD-dependent epimerase/dehydratase family protein [Verrucomicrobiae bacterium]|nr:NAD-dependent epimerase/dehydratase family protein [Verrucomicrobiae bacterium]